MENSQSLDFAKRAANQSADRPGTTSPTPPVNQSEAESRSLSNDDSIAKEQSASEAKPLKERSLSPQVSKTLSLEPPPVVKRPPKIRSDGFNFAASWWFSWDWSERKEVLHCSRAVQQSYSSQSTFRFLGFSLSNRITYRASEGGIDTAVKHIRVVSEFRTIHHIGSCIFTHSSVNSSPQTVLSLNSMSNHR